MSLLCHYVVGQADVIRGPGGSIVAAVLQTAGELGGSAVEWVLDSVVPKDWFAATNNHPLLVNATGPDGERAHWVLKPYERLGGPSSIRELVGARFARWLGVPVPDFGVINVRADVVDRLSSPIADRLRASIGPNFGSRFVDGFVDLEMPGAVAQDARSTAVDIFALDVMIDHGDRTAERSNILIGDGALMAIDHEYTFSFFELIGGPGPSWVNDIFFRLASEHFFAERFNHWRASLDHIRERLTELDARTIDLLTADVPHRWKSGSGADCLTQIAAFLSDLANKQLQILRHLKT